MRIIVNAKLELEYAMVKNWEGQNRAKKVKIWSYFENVLKRTEVVNQTFKPYIDALSQTFKPHLKLTQSSMLKKYAGFKCDYSTFKAAGIWFNQFAHLPEHHSILLRLVKSLSRFDRQTVQITGSTDNCIHMTH